MILEMPPRELHSSAKLPKFSLLLCFEPIQLYPSVNSQALSIRFKCLTCVFILWEFRSVSGYKVPDFPSPRFGQSPAGCTKLPSHFPGKCVIPQANLQKLPVDQQLFADETELNLPILLDGKLFYLSSHKGQKLFKSNSLVFCCESFSWLDFSRKIKVGLPEAPICDLTPVPLESVKLPLILGRERSTWKKHPK